MVSLPLPLPKQDPGLVETESGEAAVCISQPASREMLARVAGPLVTGWHKGGGAQKGQCRGSENKFTYFCLLRAGLNF